MLKIGVFCKTLGVVQKNWNSDLSQESNPRMTVPLQSFTSGSPVFLLKRQVLQRTPSFSCVIPIDHTIVLLYVTEKFLSTLFMSKSNVAKASIIIYRFILQKVILHRNYFFIYSLFIILRNIRRIISEQFENFLFLVLHFNISFINIHDIYKREDKKKLLNWGIIRKILRLYIMKSK